MFHLVDPGERELPTTGDTLLVDPETKEELNVNITLDIRVAYQRGRGTSSGRVVQKLGTIWHRLRNDRYRKLSF